MKLLFDHNISHKLVAKLADVFPGSTQTRLLNFSRTNDPQIWRFARTNDFVIVSKDKDLAELAVLRGAPPKVIWLRMGNCRTAAIESALREKYAAIEELVRNPEKVVLEILD